MRITIDFDSWDEMEAFRTSGKRTRGGKKDGSDDAAETVTPPPATSGQIGAPAFNPPATQATTGFGATAQPAPGASATTGFPAAGAAPAIHPLAKAIIDRADSAINAGNPVGPVLDWFKTQIGPDAKDANWDQMKSVYIPRLSEVQLRQIAPQLGVPVQ